MDQEKITKFGTYMETENPTKLTGDKITRFVERLKKIGIDVKLSGNFPWVYIDEICGIKVTETFEANHGFTLIFLPGRNDSPVSEFTDIEEIFKLIRKYIKEAKFRQIEKLKAQIEILNEIGGRFNIDNRFYIDDKIEQLEQQLKEIRK
jgi:hypothetical protein